VLLMAQTLSTLSPDQVEDACRLLAARTHASVTPSLNAPHSSSRAAHDGLHRARKPRFTATPPPSSPSAAHDGLHRAVNPIFTATPVLKKTPNVAPFTVNPRFTATPVHTTMPYNVLFADQSTTSSDLLYLSTSSRPKEPLFHGTLSHQDFLDPFHSQAVSGATQSVLPSLTTSVPTLQSVCLVQHGSGHFFPPPGHLWHSVPSQPKFLVAP
jgi:hypothetical protein